MMGVIGKPGRVDKDDMIEAALFQSGRPIIIVPYIQKDDLNLDHMVCCWDGSQAAARAFMLTNAETVDLLIAQNEKTKNDDQEIRGVDMAAHLARPDVKVEIEIIPAADFDVADTVLSYAAENSATLIVMGGYGHARLRELILGGVTRDILKSMTVPVVSH